MITGGAPRAESSWEAWVRIVPGMRVLVIDDDLRSGASLCQELSGGGHNASRMSGQRVARADVQDTLDDFDVVVADWRSAAPEGAGTLRRLRCRAHPLPIVVLANRWELSDQMIEASEDLDDLLLKPFKPAELHARIQTVVQRHVGMQQMTLSTPTLTLERNSLQVLKNEQRINLTPREYALLQALMMRPGALLSRADLEQRIYSWPERVQSNAVEYLIHALRRKIGYRQIENVRGVGWRVSTSAA